MSKPANKTLIGAFVVGAIVLLVAAVLIFGGGKFFKKTQKVVMFFDGSIKGLNIGSPVMFKGVKIGSVTDVNLILNAQDLSLRTPVVAELDPQRWTLVGGKRGDVKRLQLLIDRGLRAQLQMQSFVTGQLMIALDFFPDKSARYVGLVKEYPEIPTVPTSIEELAKTIQDLPLKEIVTNLNSAIDGIQKIVNSPDTKESVKSIHLTLKEVRALVTTINEKIDPLMANLSALTEDAGESLKQAKNTVSVLEQDAKELVSTTKKTLESVQYTLKQSEKTLNTFSDDSRLVYEMNKTMKEMSSAARSVRQLSDYLERHPEAILKGKPKQEGVSR
ncbi:MAG: MlaD family protein [Nitrospirota bacterium]